MTSDIRDSRWAMGLGIEAGKALANTEIALRRVMAHGVSSDFDVKVRLRQARCELNHLARRISRLVDELEQAQKRVNANG